MNNVRKMHGPSNSKKKHPKLKKNKKHKNGYSSGGMKSQHKMNHSDKKINL